MEHIRKQDLMALQSLLDERESTREDIQALQTQQRDLQSDLLVVIELLNQVVHQVDPQNNLQMQDQMGRVGRPRNRGPQAEETRGAPLPDVVGNGDADFGAMLDAPARPATLRVDIGRIQAATVALNDVEDNEVQF